MWAHGASKVELADLPAFGRAVRLVWAKRRWRCPRSGCGVCTFTDALAHARQVADPFHVIKLANSAIDEVRRRVQNDTTGGRGTQHDPLYRIRRLLLKAAERVTDNGRHKLRGLLAAGDPRGEAREAWRAKETLRGVYRIRSRALAAETVDELARDLQDDTFSPELNKLGRTLAAWRTQITNRHRSQVTN